MDEFSTIPSNLNLKSATKEYICTRCKKTYKEEITTINGCEAWKPGSHMCKDCRKELIHALSQKVREAKL